MSSAARRSSERELDLMRGVQRVASAPVVAQAARGLSGFGEHALGWIALGGAGVLVDRHHRDRWVALLGAAVAAHGAAVVVKRVVRRRRPPDGAVQVLVSTPSDLSFPSAHATSTTAAMVVAAGWVPAPVAVGVIAAMAGSRVVLGVHYPTDVAAGMALGGAVGAVARRLCAERLR